MSKIFAFFFGNWQLIGVGILVAAIAFLLIDRAGLKATIATDEGQIKVLSAANQQFQIAVTTQNKKVTDLQAEDAARAAGAAEALRQADLTVTAHKNLITLINSIKLSGNDCKDANSVVNAYMQRVKP